jgi:hypothetical protein
MDKIFSIQGIFGFGFEFFRLGQGRILVGLFGL